MSVEETKEIAIPLFRKLIKEYPVQKKEDIEKLLNVLVCCLFLVMGHYIPPHKHRIFARDIYDMLIKNLDAMPKKENG